MNKLFNNLLTAIAIDNLINNSSKVDKDNKSSGCSFVLGIIVLLFILEKLSHYFVTHFTQYFWIIGIILVIYTLVKPRIEEVLPMGWRRTSTIYLLYIVNFILGFIFMSVLLSNFLGGEILTNIIKPLTHSIEMMTYKIPVLNFLVDFLSLILLIVAGFIDIMLPVITVPIVQIIYWKKSIRKKQDSVIEK